jgi:hypothetical protein
VESLTGVSIGDFLERLRDRPVPTGEEPAGGPATKAVGERGPAGS